MPIGSTFSIEQTIIQLFLLSLTTSISNSFHPIRDSSIRISLTGDRSNPFLHMSSKSLLLYAMPPPSPPKVKDGLMIAGKPTKSKASRASSILVANLDLAVSSPISVIACLNLTLSSAISIEISLAPIISTLCFFKIPLFSSLRDAFNAVCPPIVGNIASGFSN